MTQGKNDVGFFFSMCCSHFPIIFLSRPLLKQNKSYNWACLASCKARKATLQKHTSGRTRDGVKQLRHWTQSKFHDSPLCRAWWWWSSVKTKTEMNSWNTGSTGTLGSTRQSRGSSTSVSWPWPPCVVFGKLPSRRDAKEGPAQKPQLGPTQHSIDCVPGTRLCPFLLLVHLV